MSLDETLNIDTPENVRFDYDIAGIGSRFTAALVDTILILILQGITNLLVILVISRTGGINEGLEGAASWVIALVGLISFLFLWGYYIFFEMLWNGQTPGKKLIHLRVIRADGTSITLTESIIRNLVRLADFLPAFYGIGAITIFVNRQTRRLGDLAAGTLVVREKHQMVTLKDLDALHASVRPQARSADTPSPALLYPVERLSYQDIQMIESFFQRKSEIINQDVLARQLLKRLFVKMALPEEGSSEPSTVEASLKTILNEYRQFHQ